MLQSKCDLLSSAINGNEPVASVKTEPVQFHLIPLDSNGARFGGGCWVFLDPIDLSQDIETGIAALVLTEALRSRLDECVEILEIVLASRRSTGEAERHLRVTVARTDWERALQEISAGSALAEDKAWVHCRYCNDLAV